MSKQFDFMSVADLCVDVILQGNVRPQFGQAEQWIDNYGIELGGSATIFAAQWVNLGGSGELLGVVGNDLLGSFVSRRLAEVGIDGRRVNIRDSVKTGVGFSLVDGADRAILTFSGSIDEVGPEDLLPEMFNLCRHWHIASFFLLRKLRVHWETWLRLARSMNVTTSLDPNWAPDGEWQSILPLLPLVDVLLCNENEATAITGCHNFEDAGRALVERGPLVVIKRGSAGAALFDRHGCIFAPTFEEEPIRIVDSIGAGDCFDAGFLRAWQLGWSMDRCLDLAMRCGKASLGAAGGFAGQLREVLR